jgi:hypothetical protein
LIIHSVNQKDVYNLFRKVLHILIPAKNAAKEFYKAMKAKRPASPELMQLIAFRSAQAAFPILHDHHVGECDYNYFKDKGWLDRTTKYFIDIKVNPVKNLIAVLMGKIVKRNITKDFHGVPW